MRSLPSALCVVLLLLPLAASPQVPDEQGDLLDERGNLLEQRGLDALRQHRYQEALVAFEELLSREPDRVSAYYGKGLAFTGILNYSAAVGSLEKAVSLHPALGDAWRRLVVLYSQLQRDQSAKRAYEKARQVAEVPEEERLDLARALRKTGWIREARKLLEESREPPGVDEHLELGLLALEEDDYPRAARHLQEATADPSRSAAEAEYQYGRTLEALERWEQAAEHYRRALSKEPRLLRARFRLGNLVLRSGKPERLAIEMFERAVELDPRFARAYSRLSIAHSSFFHLRHDHTEERLAKAMEAVTRALSLQPDLPAAHLALGYYFYYGKREYERALRELAIAEKGLPNNSLIFEAMGYIRRRQGRFEESLENIEKAIQLSPLAANLLVEQAYTYQFLRRYEEAERYYDLAISAAPDAIGTYLGKAGMEWLRGRVRRARATLGAMPSTDDPEAARTWFLQEIMERNYEQALERLPSVSLEFLGGELLMPRSLHEGHVYQKLDKPEPARTAYEGARAILERELEKRPDGPWLHGWLGVAYAGLGRKEEAIRKGKLATELYPTSLDAFWGPYHVETLALIYTMVGEHDGALDQIDQLLSIPSYFSVGILELDPSWDPLRSHRRYQEIVEKYSPPTSGTN